MVQFHLDEHIATAVAAALRLHGIDVTTTADVGMLGVTDTELLSFAASQSRVLVTYDRDFLRLHAQEFSHAGIAYCHQDKHTIGGLIRALKAIHATFTAEEVRGRVMFL